MYQYENLTFIDVCDKPSNRENLLALLKKRCYKKGSFKLSSGLTSDHYIDIRQASMHPKTSDLIGKCFISKAIELLSWQEFGYIDSIGGMATGSIPIICSLIKWPAYIDFAQWEGFYVYKDKKDYGTQCKIAGKLNTGDSVLLVEDVTTTGSSVIEAARAVREVGGEIAGVVTLVDRLQGAKEAMVTENLLFDSIFTIEDFIK